MQDIKPKLKDVVIATMIPEVESYIYDLHELLKSGKATEDDIDAIKEMESFLVELQNIVEAIDTDQMNEEQAEEVYGNIMELLEHED